MQWRRVYEEWERLSDADRGEIERLILKLEEQGKLDELLRKEYFARKLYDEKLSPILEKAATEREWEQLRKELESKFEETLTKWSIEPRGYRGRFSREFAIAKEMYLTTPKREAFKKTRERIKAVLEDVRRIAKPPLAPPPKLAPPARIKPPTIPKRLVAVMRCPKCGGVARRVTMTVRNPLTGEFEIRGRYVCQKCGWKSEWETVGFLL